MTRRRVALSVVVLVLAVAGVLVAVFWRGDTPRAAPPAAPPAGSVTDLPTGWRWEAYGGVEVQVPADWGNGIANYPPCLSREKHQPHVGRPGVVPLVMCSGPPVPALELRAPYLWFSNNVSADRVQTYDGGWVSQTRTVAGTTFTVFSDDPDLRTRILGSARPAAGATNPACPADHPARTNRDARPDPGKPGLAPVESITVCRYSLTGNGPAVLSTSQLTGDQAAAVSRAILAAPEGTGPDSPDNCAAEYAAGDELVVLRIAGGTEVVVRYSGCVGHGFDDGHTRRKLTADAIRPVLSGPHHPATLSGPVSELVWGVR
ncbi:MAG TPA: hypothetical protein VFV67_00875 [Actinophytocola sp.]|uniref:hypothetical protein n=1 Tax=Actinophytocola sp. TaxID=1872138 RepID=UPI002DB9BD9D|nr:hypothetical protein [Actinophytocola sp.]HEU5469176.1 hypothetical protein [Actinophytocola sp.]